MTDQATSKYDEAIQRRGLTETHLYLVAAVPAGATVLELGPASGYMTKLLADKGCVVDAVEVNVRDAAKAKSYCRTMIVASVEDAGTFDRLAAQYTVVLMADVLEHLRAPEVVLQMVRRRLAPGGEALVSLPNIAHWRMRLSLLFGRFEYSDTELLDRTHLRFYTLKTGKRLFEDAGFKVAKVVVPPAPHSRIRPIHHVVRQAFPTLFSVNFIYHLYTDTP
jgi:2-polyprenyl-3-methyl-5-hydroxy-6-metoxy-1,4-benzoquinol methylase